MVDLNIKIRRAASGSGRKAGRGRERQGVGREQEREGGVREILVTISGVMQDGEYNR